MHLNHLIHKEVISLLSPNDILSFLQKINLKKVLSKKHMIEYLYKTYNIPNLLF